MMHLKARDPLTDKLVRDESVQFFWVSGINQTRTSKK